MDPRYPLFVLVLYTVTVSSVKYDGTWVLKLFPRTKYDLHMFNIVKLQNPLDISPWSWRGKPGNPFLTSISPKKIGPFLQNIKFQGMRYTVLSKNLQHWIDRERQQNLPLTGEPFDYRIYHSYADILGQLKNMVAKYPSLVSLKYASNNSVEGRKIPIIVLDNKSDSQAKEIVFFECGIHAREWISPATCLWILNQLVSNSSNSNLLSKYSFHFMPITNPDGYVYTWTEDRLWRKNRRKALPPICYGVDLNRNFDTNFGGPRTSPVACSSNYHGQNPFSEPESLSIAKYLKSFGSDSNLAVCFQLHSYSQFWMFPPGTKGFPVPDTPTLAELAAVAAEAIRKTHNKTYKTGSKMETIYPAAGSSCDWVYRNTPCKMVFSIELRDTGTYGFMLPSDQIEPTGEEIFNGIKALLNKRRQIRNRSTSSFSARSVP